MANDRCIGGGMAYFFRLIFALISLVPLSSQAIPQVTEYRICGNDNFCTAWGTSYQLVNNIYYEHLQSLQAPACTSTHNEVITYEPATATPTSGAAVRKVTIWNFGCGSIAGTSQTNVFIGMSSRGGQCPANSTADGGNCTCNPGYQENSDSTSCLPETPPDPPCEAPNVIKDGVCGPPDPPKCNYPPGAPMPDTLFQMGGGANYKGGYICYLNCEAVPDMRGQKDGKWFHWGPYTSTGATCANSTGDSTGGQPTPDNPDGVPPPPDPDAPPRDPPPPPPEPPPEQCKKGTCPGSINGITVCMPCQETRSPQPVPGAPPNSPSAPPDPTGNNAPPDTKNTTQSATNCKDGKCTTTTTKSTTDANGVTTTNSHTKTESKDDFCTSNPRSSMCIDGAFGGACAGGFVCEGDAVQCAMAKEQHSRNCKMFDDFSSAEAQLYETESTKTGNVTDDLPGNETVSIGPQDFDTSNAFGGGAICIADKTITVMNQSITLPFSNVCPYLAILGNILMSVSFLLAARIVIRG